METTTQNGHTAAPMLKRPHYFERQQLSAADLTAEQHYWRERLRRHNRFVHGWGVVCGAEVTLADPADAPWLVRVAAGYVLTPHGDEVYIPESTTFDVLAGVEACLGVPPPCPEPEILEERAAEGLVQIIQASIDPPGLDVGSNYNDEWIEIMVMETTSLRGFSVQHTINPGEPTEGFRTYFAFEEETTFAAGTIIRIHSGVPSPDAEQADRPGFAERFTTPAGQVGQWWLNNTGETIRVLDPNGGLVDIQTFLPSATVPITNGTAYLVVCPHERPACPRPAVPAPCQPAGGVYAWSRLCETYALKVVCALPPSHEVPPPPCDVLEEIVCGQAHVPCPPTPDADDNCVVLATLTVGGERVLTLDDLRDRRRLLASWIQQAYLRCQCGLEPPPAAGTITAIIPSEMECDPQRVVARTAVIQGSGLQGATGVLFQDQGIQTSIQDNSDPAQLTVLIGLAPGQAGGQHPFTVTFDDGRPPIRSSDFGVLFETLPCITVEVATGTITGTVTSNGDPLPGATVLLAPLRRAAVTTASGSFTLSGVPAGAYTIRATVGALQSPTLPVTVTGGQTTVVNLTLRSFGDPTGPTRGDVFVDLNPTEFDFNRGVTERVDLVSNVGDARRTALETAGIRNVLDLARATPDFIRDVLGVSDELATQIQNDAQERIRFAT